MIKYVVSLPLGSPVGNEYLVADVDPSNLFMDSNLTNNVSVGQVPISIT